ncbi:MAG: hypothetical protein ACFB16_07425 [Phormidesmis sp.]
MGPLLTQLLVLQGVDVKSYKTTGDELVLSVERHTESATGRRCGTIGTHLYRNHSYLVRDLHISH